MPLARSVATLTAAVFLALSTPARADVMLGAAAPLSGPYAALGEQLKRGAQLAVDDINAKGGLRGERLVLMVADDACDPRKAVEVATAFVQQGVKAVIGHYCSGASIPAAKIYETAGILEISPASTQPKLTELGLWNVLRTAPRDDAQGVFAAAMLAEKFKDRKIAIVADQAPANAQLAARVKDALAAKGLTPAAFATFTAGAKDYRALAQTLSEAGTEVLYFAGAYPEAGIILKNLKDLDRTVQLVSDDGLVTDEFWLAAGDLGEGALMTFPPDPLDNPAALPVIQRLREAGFVAEGYTINAYAAVQAWVAGADATAGGDARGIAAWLKGGSAIDTVLGPLRFDAKGDVADPHFAWFRWSGGKYGPVPAP